MSPCRFYRSMYYSNSWIIGNTKALLHTGSEEREVLEVGSIPVAILPSCQDVQTIAL